MTLVAPLMWMVIPDDFLEKLCRDRLAIRVAAVNDQFHGCGPAHEILVADHHLSTLREAYYTCRHEKTNDSRRNGPPWRIGPRKITIGRAPQRDRGKRNKGSMG